MDQRLDWIDGLRGVAVALVVVFHAWAHALPAGTYAAGVHPHDPFTAVASRGFEGVSLFLVLSGLCLSLPLLRRRGSDGWLRQFALRRCRRILPPYYAALALFALVSLASWPKLTVVGPLSLGSVVTHVLLVQNVTPYANSLNGSFWSLGLEWQWYVVFPLVLLCCIRRLRLTLALLALLAIWWHVGMHDLWGIGALPARLFEFGVGIGVAHLMVEKRLPHPLVSGILGAISLAFAETGVLDAMGLHQVLYGLAFSSLMLLAASVEPIRRCLSGRWLTRLGVASYSVYLVHEPVVQAIDVSVPEIAMPLACIGAVAAGVAFYALCERPLIRWRSNPIRGPVSAQTQSLVAAPAGSSSCPPHRSVPES